MKARISLLWHVFLMLLVSTSIVVSTFVPTPAYAQDDGCATAMPDESTPANKPENIEAAGGQWKIDLTEFACFNLVFEGRITPGERVRRIIDLKQGNVWNAKYVVDGVFTYSEGSIWLKQSMKNIEDFNNVIDPPEMGKLINEGRKVMNQAGYDWTIVAGFLDGSSKEYAPGTVWEGTYEVASNCDLKEPVQINIHGEYIPGGNFYLAAIGGLNCTTLAWIDEATTPVRWVGVRDAGSKVKYVTIKAYLMPNWTDQQINDWADKQ